MSVGVVGSAQRPTLRVLPHVLLGVVLLAHLALIVPSLFTQRLWEDEAFNLTVPLNLLGGLGYTSDGTLSGSQLTPFDVRISTGPVVLLPAALFIGLGFDPVIGGRVVAAGFWILLIVGLVVLGKRVSGVWGAVVAATVPLTLHTFQGHSPIQGPADVLGEPAAAALIVWAVVLMRRKPALAGLVAGLAIQAKFIALLALPALAIGLLVCVAARPRRWIGVLWKPAVFAMLPTLLYELAALMHLGFGGFLVHAKQFVFFLLSSGQTVQPTSFAERMHYLMSSWFMPGAVMWGVVGVSIVLVSIALTRLARTVSLGSVAPKFGSIWPSQRTAPRERIAIAVVALVGVTIYLLWWGTASHTPLWIRHPSPALLSFVPMLGAFVVLGIHTLRVNVAGELRGHRASTTDQARGVAGSRDNVARGASALLGVGFGVLMLAQAGAHLHAAYDTRAETLQSQRVHAAALVHAAVATGHLVPTETSEDAVSFVHARDGSAWIAADPWGSAVNIVFLTGAHIGLADAPSMSDAARIAGGECTAGDPLATSGPYALCKP